MEARIDKSLQILAKTPTIIAAFDRLRNHKDPISPKPGLSHAANFLYMLSDNVPDAYDTHVMDVALILHAEHEMNASTFACTVTASTLSRHVLYHHIRNMCSERPTTWWCQRSRTKDGDGSW